MKLKNLNYMLAAIALHFSLTAYAAAPSTAESASPPAPESKEVSIEKEIASNPAKFLQAAIKADSMGRLYAVVNNTSDVAVANVHVIVVHFDATTRQPDRQTDPLLVAARLAPKQSAQIKLEGLQVYKQAEFNLYRAFLAKAELDKQQ